MSESLGSWASLRQPADDRQAILAASAPYAESTGPADLLPANESAVHMAGVSKSYRHFALSDVDLQLAPGQVLGLVGPNGAGKSTTLRILMGLVHQDRGEVHVLGYRMPQQQAEAKLHVGYASEDMRLYQQATLAWHMRFVRSIYPGWDPQLAKALLRRFDLPAEHPIKGLSHGQRVKAGLLLALARRPPLLILDEPTTGLDPVARREVVSELMEVLADESRTIVFSSHNTSDVEQISDHITFIDRGRVVSSSDKESYLERWRRIRLQAAPGRELAHPAGVVRRQRDGQFVTLVTQDFTPSLIELYTERGATVQSVQRLSLEEIFIETVGSNRAGDDT